MREGAYFFAHERQRIGEMKTLATPLGLAGPGSRSTTERSDAQFFDRRVAGVALSVALAYYLGAKIGFALTFQPHPVSVLWPPNSILLAALLLTPVRVWWVILLAAFPAHLAVQLQSNVPPMMILCWFISNACEALIGAGCVRYLIDRPVRFDRLRNVGLFCLFAAFLGPFLSSFLDTAFVSLNHWGQGSYWEIWRIRFTSNVLAALTVAPLIVTWATSGIASLRKARRSRYLEAGLLLLGLLSVSFAVLYRLGSGTDSALLYLLLPFLLWAAVQFGSCGASTVLGIVTFSAIWGATHGHGPFAGGSAEQNALAVQVFLIVLSVPLMFLAAVIEERAKGETELRESEERFRVVADSAPVLIWMSGLDKLCTFFNKGWLEFTGRTMDQEMGNGWAEGVHPDDLQRCLKVYTEAFDARKSFVMQYRLRRHDGEYRWISDHGVARHDAQGNFTGYIGSCMDITELLSKDEALHDSQERMSLAAEAAGLVAWTWDIRRDEVWLSDKDRAFFGFSQSEKLNSERVRSVVHSEDRQFVRQLVENSLRTRDEIEAEYRVVLPDGKVRWVTRRGRVEFDGNGEPTWERGVLMDVTERKQAEEKFRLATEASPSGIVLVNDRGRIVLVNTHVEKLFGYEREELVGKLVDVLVPEQFASQHPKHRGEFLATPT